MLLRMIGLLLIAWLFCGFNKVAEIPLEDLRSGISDHSLSVKNFSVTCDYKVLQRDLATGKSDDPVIVHAVITVDMNGRVKYESFDKKEEGKKSDERHNIAVY